VGCRFIRGITLEGTGTAPSTSLHDASSSHLSLLDFRHTIPRWKD